MSSSSQEDYLKCIYGFVMLYLVRFTNDSER